MAGQLPLELWTQIAQHLHADGSPLRQYALVSRAWQAAFEPFIYNKPFEVHSDDFRTRKGVLSLKQFESMTSGNYATRHRRRAIRLLRYTIVIPYDLPDYKSRIIRGLPPNESYTRENPIREANDEAFALGIKRVFETLASWSQSYRLRLDLEVLGHEDILEPGTREYPDLTEYTSVRRGDRWVVRPYRVRFPNNRCQLPLPRLPCVDQLIFRNISGGSALQIAHFCPTLRDLHLDLWWYVRPDHVDYAQEHRRGIAENLLGLPQTLKTFEFRERQQEVWYASIPGPDLLAAQKDDRLSISVRQISTYLQELNLSGVCITPDFLWPLDENDNPTSEPVDWPYLRVLKREEDPNFLPTGKWLLDSTPEELAENEVPDLDGSDSEDYETFRILDYSPYERSMLKMDLCQRCYVSLGHAAQRMPRLEQIEFYYTVFPTNKIEVSKDPSTGKIQLEWESEPYYKPDQAVASAWGVQLADMHCETCETSYSTSRVEMPKWPPGISI